MGGHRVTAGVLALRAILPNVGITAYGPKGPVCGDLAMKIALVDIALKRHKMTTGRSSALESCKNLPIVGMHP
jgi:hypothetical protein